MTRPVKLTALALVAAVLALGCSRDAARASATLSQPRAVAVEVATVTPTTLTQTVEVVGTLEPRFFADVKSEFTAVVEEVYVTQWVQVSKGTPLAKLDTREADAQLRAAHAMALQAEVGERRAQRELERTLKLKEYGLVTQQNLDDARSAHEAAVAAAQAAAAELSAAEAHHAKSVIRAPMAGIVAYRGISVGDRVESMGGGPMFRIVDPRVLELTVLIPSTRSAAVQVGQEIAFSVDSFPGKSFTGRIMHINPSADPVSRTVKVLAEVPNPDGVLRGGTFAKGTLRIGERTGVLLVPRVALLSWDVAKGTAEVFVVTGDTAERRTVRTGEASGDGVEVAAGLAAGERVVSRGGFNLKPGDRVLLAAAEGV